MNDVTSTEGATFLYHLALRCAALPGFDRADDVNLLAERSGCLDDLMEAALVTAEHSHAHPDDAVLAAAHRLLFDAHESSTPRARILVAAG